MGEAAPGASRDVGFAKFSRELVEVFRRTIRAFFQAKTESGAVGRGLGQGVGGLLDERADEGLPSRRTRAVVTVFAEAPVADQSGTPQEGEVGGNAGLPHGEDFLELGDGELFLFEQQEDPEPGGFGQGFQCVEEGGHAGRRVRILQRKSPVWRKEWGVC